MTTKNVWRKFNYQVLSRLTFTKVCCDGELFQSQKKPNYVGTVNIIADKKSSACQNIIIDGYSSWRCVA